MIHSDRIRQRRDPPMRSHRGVSDPTDRSRIVQQHTCPLCGCAGAGPSLAIASIAFKFWSRVDVRAPSECWEWQGARSASGHGRFRIPTDVSLDDAGHVRGTHRVAYWLDRGEWPGDLVVRHSCDNPPCVNPAHLLLGTHADNVRDKMERGRQPLNQNARKTHCLRGHEFNPENSVVDCLGRRVCLICRRIRQKKLRLARA